MGKIKNAIRDVFHKPYKDSNGYEHRYRPESYSADGKGYAPTHRVVAEEKVGGEIYQGRVVHHRDGNKLNNKPENLQVMQREKHNDLHGIKFAKKK